MNNKEVFTPKTRTQLATELGISRRTLYKIIKELNLSVTRGLLYGKALKSLYDELGISNRANEPEKHDKIL